MLKAGVMNTSDGTIDKAYTVDKFRKFMVRWGLTLLEIGTVGSSHLVHTTD